MPRNAERAYADWLEADTEARKAESRLKGAWLAYDRDGAAPSRELLTEVSKLRSIATAKLRAAVDALSSPARKA